MLKGYQMMYDGDWEDPDSPFNNVALNISFQTIVSNFEEAVRKQNEQGKKKRKFREPVEIDDSRKARLKRQREDDGQH